MMRKDVKPAITKLKNDQVNHDTQTKMCVIMINDDNIQEGSNTVIPFTYIFENSYYQSRVGPLSVTIMLKMNLTWPKETDFKDVHKNV